jgi:hypothetical protein
MACPEDVALRPGKLSVSVEKNRTGMTVHKTKFSGVSSLLLGLALGSKRAFFHWIRISLTESSRSD